MRTVTVAGLPVAAADEIAQANGNNEAMTVAANAMDIRRDVNMSQPLPTRALWACGRRQVSWLPGLPSAPSRSAERPISGCACAPRLASPVTVAGPLRIRNGFPFHRPYGRK